ncbi:DNA-binding protein [Saccharibacillus sp. O23]|nr:DNA-binding protein [Saccharibacillus sp. O23]
MQGTTLLRNEIEKGIAASGMTLAEFSVRSGVNRGIFSAILRTDSPKPISLNQLEKIGEGLAKPPDWMFECYAEECFFGGKPNRRRVEPFLVRCAELDRTDCVEAVLERWMEDPRQLEHVFELAEDLYARGRKRQSLIFYRRVVRGEKYHQSQRLAVSQYRLFVAAIGEDNERNLCAAIEFEPFCDKLPDRYRIDGIMRLYDVYLTLGKINKAEYYALELGEFAHRLHKEQTAYFLEKGMYPDLGLVKPLVVYYGYSYLSMENVQFRKGQLDEALASIQAYADLSWFPNQDDFAHTQIAKFAQYARQNETHLKLLIGREAEETIRRCVGILENDPPETLVSLFFLVKAANRHGWDVDGILDRFEKQFERALEEEGRYPRNNLLNRYENVCYQMALYFFARNAWDKGHDRLLDGLDVAIAINDRDMFAKCVPLFEKNRLAASEAQLRRYGELLAKVKTE